jgi:hypothetical protein
MFVSASFNSPPGYSYRRSYARKLTGCGSPAFALIAGFPVLFHSADAALEVLIPLPVIPEPMFQHQGEWGDGMTNNAMAIQQAIRPKEPSK